MPDTFYVTTPIYYVNDKPHLGHVYTTTVADVVARYHRLKGDDTFFLTGVDEHAAKVSDKAAEHGVTPQQWADQNAAAFRETFDKLDLRYDDFVRTSSDQHKTRVTEYVAALLKSGDVYEGEYSGWYDAGQEEYVPEIKAKAQDYRSDVNGKPLVNKSEKNYFFKLSAYREALLEHFDQHEDFVQPQARRNEIINRIKEAQDIPISRTGAGGWGIPVPGDPEQTIYVWVDALFNYLTYTDRDDRDDRRHYWQSGATHFIAKDILWFHACIWPALLLALRKCPGYDNWHGLGPIALPKQIYAHSYWVSATGEKMSKSLGNFLDPEAIDNYTQEFGLDALRYFLATRGPLGTTDSTFNPDLFIETYNADLANTFGNSCSRVTNMIGKYCDAKTPKDNNHCLVDDPGRDPVLRQVRPPARQPETMLERQCRIASSFSLQDWQELAPQRVSEHVMRYIVQYVDGFIEETAPFKLAKDPDKLPEVGTILYNCIEALRIASVLLWPFIPHKVEEFWRRIGCGAYADQLNGGSGDAEPRIRMRGLGDLDAWVQWGQLQPGTPIEKGDPLFPRYQVPPK